MIGEPETPEVRLSHDMRIAIAIYGIPRGAQRAQPSLVERILRPAQACGEVALFGHLFQQDRVQNERSGESGELTAADYGLYAAFKPMMEAPGTCLERWGCADLCRFGDIYGDAYGSLKNLVHQLHSLREVTLQMERHAPDVVVFARPDLQYHDALPRHVLTACQRHARRVYLPPWQWWSGYNDRLAVCGSSSFKAYGRRVELALDYCRAEGRRLHAERLLRHALTQGNTAVRTVSMRASRVRVGNTVKEEIFDARQTLGEDSRLLPLELNGLRLLSWLRL
jgi:hypothetical protein